MRRAMAGIFLLLFAFAITPKLVLHNFVANHTDGKRGGTFQHPQAGQFSKASFNCPCDDLVSESPFVSETYTASHLLQIPFSRYYSAFVEQVHATQLFCSQLRGPPAC